LETPTFSDPTSWRKNSAGRRITKIPSYLKKEPRKRRANYDVAPPRADGDRESNEKIADSNPEALPGFCSSLAAANPSGRQGRRRSKLSQ